MKLLVAVDGSAHAKRAFETALKLKKADDTLIILSVGEWKAQFLSLLKEQEQIEHKKKALEATEKLVNDTVALAAGVPNVIGKAVLGNPKEQILHIAKDENVDVIYIGCRGLGKLKRLLIGSVSDCILEHAHCDVFIVKGNKNSSTAATSTDDKQEKEKKED